MKSGILKSIFFAFIATLAMFTLMKGGIKERISSITNYSFSIRRLESKESAQEIENNICKKSSSELVDFYKKTDSNYTFKVTDGNDLIPEIFNKDIINGVSKDQIKKYIISNGGYVFLIVLWVIFVLLWIPFYCCVTCHCCKCPEACVKCPSPFLLISLLISGILIVLCSIGYTKNNGIMNGLFGLGCSVLKLEDHLVRGDEYKVVPYWVGLTEIRSKIKVASDSITSLSSEATEIKENLDKIGVTDIENELQTEYDDKKDTTLTNPTPDGAALTPNYLTSYGPYTQEKTALYSIDYELNEFSKGTKNTIGEILDIINLSEEKLSDTTSQLDKFQTYIDNIVNKADSFVEENVGEYTDYLDTADSYFRSAMNIIFSINLALGILLAVSLVCLFIFNVGKCTLCISWILLYTLMIFTFLTGIIFGLTGTIFKDASYGTSYILKDIKEVKIIEDTSTMDLINTCINGNGSIVVGESLDVSAGTNLIDSIYNLEGNITKGIDTLQTYEFTSVKENVKQYELYMENIKVNSEDLRNALSEIKKYTDSSDTETKVPDDDIYDDWEVRKEDCPDGYTYISPSSGKRLRNLVTEDKKCLVITEWEKEDIIKRYNEITATTDFAGKYYDSITSFYNDNKELLTKMKDDDLNFQKSDPYLQMITDYTKVLENIKEAIQPIRQNFEDIIGDNSILDMMNCGFLKRDINKILEVLYNSLGEKFKTTSSLFIWVSILECILTIFVLILTSTYNKKNSNDIEIVNS